MNPLEESQLFFLEYKNENGVFTRLANNSYSSLNGFLKNFTTNDLSIGGTSVIDLRFYGSLKTETVKAWAPTETEKAPRNLNFSRIDYTLNDDIQYALVTFDFSESFLKNYSENIVYNDAVNRTLLSSINVKVSLGAVNQDSYDFFSGDISSDYISINGEEKIGILFTSNKNIQQFLANNPSYSRIKFLIYNYMPKNVNEADEFVPIRLELSISNELTNKITPKQIGNEFPLNKIQELSQIIELQKSEYSKTETSQNGEAKKSTYVKYTNMPITSNDIQYANTEENYFEILNSFHSASFNSLFSYNRRYTFTEQQTLNFFKLGKYVFEYKPDIKVRDALPKILRFSNLWEGSLSSISYHGYKEFRQIKETYYEIIAFLKHVIWSFNDENYYLRDRAINRRIYLNKLKNIFRNMLFIPPQPGVIDDIYYQREDIYKTLGTTYNYESYGINPLNNAGKFLTNMFARTGLFLVDLLWFLEEGFTQRSIENFRFYSSLESYLFQNGKQYNSQEFIKIDNLSQVEIVENSDSLLGYLLMQNLFIFVSNYLRISEKVNKNEFFSSAYNLFLSVNKNVVNELGRYFNFTNIFNPESLTTGEEFTFANNIDFSSKFLSEVALIVALLDDCSQYFQSLYKSYSTNVINYQYWHIIEKDFALNSVQLGDFRLVVLNKDIPVENVTLNDINTTSIINYALIDSITTTYGSTISLKTKITTNI